jgi:hypothetical protein
VPGSCEDARRRRPGSTPFRGYAVAFTWRHSHDPGKVRQKQPYRPDPRMSRGSASGTAVEASCCLTRGSKLVLRLHFEIAGVMTFVQLT